MTPPWCADIGARLATTRGVARVLDPCAGEGALLDAVLRRKPVGVHGIELDPGRAGPRGYTCGDALALPWPSADAVLMNPPFSLWQPFVAKAIELRAPRVVVLLRLGALASQRRATFWKRLGDDYGITLHVLSRRPSFTGGSTDSSDYGWFVLDRDTHEREGIRWA